MRSATVLNNARIFRSDQNPDDDVAPLYTFTVPSNPNDTTPNTTYIYPGLMITLPIGTAFLDAEIFSVKPSTSNNSASLDVSYGSWPELPVKYLSRALPGSFASLWSTWNGYTKNGTKAPAGQYTVIARALKILGDPEKSEDWDSKRTIDFNIAFA
jgi:hypothetical protein